MRNNNIKMKDKETTSIAKKLGIVGRSLEGNISKQERAVREIQKQL